MIMHIFNEAELPIIKLFRDLVTINVFATLENDSGKIVDVSVSSDFQVVILGNT